MLRRRTHLLAVGALAACALLYWKPLSSYRHTRAVLQRQEADVARLQTQKRELQRRLASVGTGQQLIREARRLGLVKPGEELFIVRGISAWRQRNR